MVVDDSAQVSVEYLVILLGALALLGMVAYVVFSNMGAKVTEVNETTSLLNETINNL